MDYIDIFFNNSELAGLVMFFVLLLGGYFFGSRNERRHLESLRTREILFRGLPERNNGKKEVFEGVSGAKVFYGSVVIGQDYFKSVVFFIINIFGGRVAVYETLLERGRREALLRVKEQAALWGADEIVNLRYETANIGQNRSGRGGAIELMAYGTGLKK